MRDHARHGWCRPPLKIERTKGVRLRDDIQRVAQMIADEFELMIRETPEQWHLLNPNWPSDYEVLGREVPNTSGTSERTSVCQTQNHADRDHLPPQPDAPRRRADAGPRPGPGIAQAGERVRVLAPCDGPPPGAGVTPLGNSLPTAANGSIAPVAPDPSAQLRVIRAMRDEDFDVIHLHEPLSPGPNHTALLLVRLR